MKKNISARGVGIAIILGLLIFLVFQNQQILRSIADDISKTAEVEQVSRKEKPRLSIIPYSNRYPSFGSDSAKVKMIAFVDYECPYSLMFIKEQLPVLLSEQVESGDLKIFFYDRPLKMHMNAYDLSREAHKAYESNNYNKFINDLNSGAIDTSNLISAGYDDLIENSLVQAGISGIVSTPVFVVNNRVLSGLRNLDELNSLIEYSKNNVIQNTQSENSCSE